jgi:hypothetical protein
MEKLMRNNVSIDLCQLTYSAALLGLSLIIWFSFPSNTVEAHRPYFPDGLNKSPYSAFQLDDIDISQAIYQVLGENEQVWLKFHPTTSSSKTVNIQLGIPVLEETESFRPVVAVVSQDLSRIDLPFNLPDGFGAIVYEVNNEESIKKFREPYTNTNSWILIEEEFEIIGNEIHYVVIFSKTNQSGKFWFATGTKEVFDFSSSQLNKSILKVKKFHNPSTPSSPYVDETSDGINSQDKEPRPQSRLQGTSYLKLINIYTVALLVLSSLLFILVKKKLR